MAWLHMVDTVDMLNTVDMWWPGGVAETATLLHTTLVAGDEWAAQSTWAVLELGMLEICKMPQTVVDSALGKAGQEEALVDAPLDALLGDHLPLGRDCPPWVLL